MKKILITLALATVVRVVSMGQELTMTPYKTTSHYLDKRFGVGLMVGEPTGLSMKYWVNENLAVDGGIAESFHRDNGLQLHSDILWHEFGIFNVSEGRLPLYFGVGPRFKFQDGDDAFGIRFPIGVSYIFDRQPIDVFFEVAPIIDVEPSVRGSFNLAIGMRFWF